MSDGRRSRTVPLTALDVAEVARQVEAYRQWREARAQIVRSFAEMLEAVDDLGRLRTVTVEGLRRARARRR